MTRTERQPDLSRSSLEYHANLDRNTRHIARPLIPSSVALQHLVKVMHTALDMIKVQAFTISYLVYPHKSGDVTRTLCMLAKQIGQRIAKQDKIA